MVVPPLYAVVTLRITSVISAPLGIEVVETLPEAVVIGTWIDFVKPVDAGAPSPLRVHP